MADTDFLIPKKTLATACLKMTYNWQISRVGYGTRMQKVDLGEKS
jgi:hypothetical protein